MQVKNSSRSPSKIVSSSPAEFRKHLKNLGHNENEIEAFMQIHQETSYLNEPLGQIVNINGCHYVYRVNGIDYDGLQTTNDCGPMAIRRKLRHMHHLGYNIDPDAWYRDSGRTMRNMLIKFLKDDLPKEELQLIQGDGFIYSAAIVRLQMFYGIEPLYATIYTQNMSYFHAKGGYFKEVLFIYDPGYTIYYDSYFKRHPDEIQLMQQATLDKTNYNYRHPYENAYYNLDYNKATPDTLDCVMIDELS
jgi:hypothetical protein